MKERVRLTNHKHQTDAESALLQDTIMRARRWYLNEGYMNAVHRNDLYGRVVATVMSVLTELGYGKRFSGMNRRGPSDIWKLGMLVLMRLIGISYAEMSACMCSFRGVMRLSDGLSEPLEESTLRKFSYRVDSNLLDAMIMEVAVLNGSTDTVAAMDATGFSDTNASTHYIKRIGQMQKSPNTAPESLDGLTYNCVAVRGFVKATFVADVSTKSVYVVDVVTDHSADVTRAKPAIDRLALDDGPSVVYLLADKGYDAEYVHLYTKEKLGATAIIPVRECEPSRNWRPEQRPQKGFNRKKMLDGWDTYHGIYARRSIVECVNSIIKRTMTGAVRSRKDKNKKDEVRYMVLAHNIRRLFVSKLV